MLLAAGLAAVAWQVQKSRQRQEAAAEPELALPAAREENYDQMLGIDLLELEVGYGLIPLVDAAQDGELLPRIRSIRKQFAMEMGFIVPPVHIKDNLQLKPNEYAILLKGMRIAGGEILPGHCLAMNPGASTETLKGIATIEPTFGLPATWISEDKKERATIAGYTVVDCTTVVATHISEIIKRHGYELIGRQEVQNLLDTVSKTYPKLVEELIPNLLTLGIVMRVLQNLLRENVSIRDIRSILESLADWAPTTRDADLLTEFVRQSLARSISLPFAQDGQMLPVLTLDRGLEATVQDSLHRSGEGSYLALDPGIAQAMLGSLSEGLQKFDGGTSPVLLCTPTIRPHVKKLTERYLPSLVVLSHNEIAANLKVRSLGTVNVNAG
jgi:flagellar biosynthesis protein FlhA